MDRRVLVVGGAADRSLTDLLERAGELGAPVRGLLVHPDQTPRLTWDLEEDTLWLDGEPVWPAGVFLRADVFWSTLDDRPEAGYRSDAWHGTLQSWARAHPDVRLLNRDMRPVSKPEALLRARRAGLWIPETVISNDLALLQARAAEGAVAKPVGGGGHCHPLAELLERTPTREGATAAPAIVQTRMPGLDVRIFAVGAERFAFTLVSSVLDYRLDPRVRVLVRPLPGPEVMAPLDRLLDELGLDFAAADLREDADGRLRFLEVNTQPMFAAFDAAVEGALSAAILGWLRASLSAPRPPAAPPRAP